MPAMVNGANEEAVAAFLAGEIHFLDIGRIVSSVLDEFEPGQLTCLADVLDADKKAREYAKKQIEILNKQKGN